MSNKDYDDYYRKQYPNREPWPTSPKEPDWKQKPPVPKPVTIADLFPRLDRWGIGWSPILDHLKEISEEKNSYPPYDLIQYKDKSWEIKMAVAGFDRESLEIFVEDRTLTIKSIYPENESDKEARPFGEVVHKGLASRAFTTKFALGTYVEVKNAYLEDGILTVQLITNIPEEKKPKVIDIQ